MQAHVEALALSLCGTIVPTLGQLCAQVREATGLQLCLDGRARPCQSPPLEVADGPGFLSQQGLLFVLLILASGHPPSPPPHPPHTHPHTHPPPPHPPHTRLSCPVSCCAYSFSQSLGSVHEERDKVGLFTTTGVPPSALAGIAFGSLQPKARISGPTPGRCLFLSDKR